MKQKIVLITTIVASCLFSIAASAQNRVKMELGYHVSTPVGSFKNDYIGKTSFSGATGEIRYLFNPNISLGISAGYQYYYEKYDRQLYEMGNQTISAVVSNDMDIIPILLRGTYFPVGRTITAVVQPYVSVGVGVNLINYGQYLGEFGGTNSDASFAFQGGAGVLFPLGITNDISIKVGATYNYINYHQNEIAKLNNIGYTAGIVFDLK